MDKIAKLGEMLKGARLPVDGSLIVGTVKSIEGDTCSVELNEDLLLTDVRLKVAIGDGEDKFIIFPAIDSLVLMGSLSGDLKELAVIKCEKIARIEYLQGDLQVIVDTETKKISVGNDEVNLKGLFAELKQLLSSFKVYTPGGPSGGPLPPTVAALQNFEQNVNKLFY